MRTSVQWADYPNIKLATNGMRDEDDIKVLFKSSCFCTPVMAEWLEAAPVKLSAGQKRLQFSYPQVRSDPCPAVRRSEAAHVHLSAG